LLGGEEGRRLAARERRRGRETLRPGNRDLYKRDDTGRKGDGPFCHSKRKRPGVSEEDRGGEENDLEALMMRLKAGQKEDGLRAKKGKKKTVSRFHAEKGKERKKKKRVKHLRAPTSASGFRKQESGRFSEKKPTIP